MKSDVPSLLMLRGLPGSGKSTLATLLSEQGRYPVTSIDGFFTNPYTGEYRFDHLQNHLAYRQCEAQTEAWMQKQAPKVFVDNTFTMEWEMAPYFKLAQKHGYRVFVITVENRHGGQNVHGVSREQLEKMAEKYKVQLMPQ